MWKRRQRNTDVEEFAPAAGSRQPNKLSKPRTNKHIPATTSRQAGKRDSRRDLAGSLPDSPELTYSSALSDADKRDLRRQAHSQIFGSSRDALSVLTDPHSKDDAHDDNSLHLSPSLEGQSPTFVKRMSLKAFALTSQSKLSDGISTSQVSLVVEEAADVPASPARSQRFSNLNLAEESGHLKEHTSYADLRDASPEETNSDEPFDAKAVKITRRSSFATPGVATRQPRLGELSPLSSHPIHEEDVAVGDTWTERLPFLPPRQHSNGSSYNGGMTTPLARAQTPAESVDYGRIGSMQLGGLVITNGKASPEPSILSARLKTPVQSLLDFRRDEEYFTASEGEFTPIASPVGNPFWAQHLDGMSLQYEGFAVGDVASQSTGHALDLPQYELHKPEQRSSSPLRHEMLATKPSIETLSIDNTEPAQASLRPTPGLVRSASHHARDYLSELAESPYEPQIARAVSLKRITVSRTVSAQSTQSGSVYSTASDEGFAEPAAAKSAAAKSAAAPQLEDIEEEMKRRTMASFQSELADRFDTYLPLQRPDEEPPTEQTPPKSARPKQSKADSGYSSSVSNLDVREPAKQPEESINDEYPLEETNFQLSNPKKRLSTASDLISLYTFDQMLSKLPSVAAHYMEPQKPRMLPSKPPKRMSLLRSVSWGKAKSEAAFASTLSVPTIASVKTMPVLPDGESTGSAKVGKDRKKLQKTRPRARTAVSMPNPRPLAGDEVPRIPSGTRAQHAKRLSQNPDTSHLERVFAGDGDEEVEKEQFLGPSFEIRFPSPTHDSDGEDEYGISTKAKRKSWRLSRKPTDEPANDRPPTPPQHRSGVGSIFRRASRRDTGERRPRRSFDDEDAVIADFATAAVSLGSSPYDIASADTTRARDRPKINTNTTTLIHPHQISTNVTRPKSWVEMDDATAAEFARQKSRQRAEMAEAWDVATGGMAPPTRSRPGTSQRPSSFHESVPVPSTQPQAFRTLLSESRAGGGGHNERPNGPQRVPSGGSDYRRGRPQSFHEWELNRRNSRSRSRNRTNGMMASETPPVPPIPAQTFEREEEQYFSDALPRQQEMPAHAKPMVQERPRSWVLPGNEEAATEEAASPPVQQQQQQQQPTQQPADWSASSDIWRQRRMLLSKNLQAQPTAHDQPSPPEQPGNALTFGEKHEQTVPFHSTPLPPAAPAHQQLPDEYPIMLDSTPWHQRESYHAPQLDFSFSASPSVSPSPAPPAHNTPRVDSPPQMYSPEPTATRMSEPPPPPPRMTPELVGRRLTPFERFAGSAQSRHYRLT